MKLEGPLKKLLVFIIICWIILAIIFGVTDLEISKAFLNRESIWANIGKYYGEGPGYGIIAVSIGILIGSREDDLKKQRTALYVILIIGIVFLIMAVVFGNIWFITFGGGISIVVLIFLPFITQRESLALPDDVIAFVI